MVDENALREDARRPWQVLAVLCLVQLVVGLDQAFMMVALPSIEHDLGFAAGDVQWVITAYAVAFGGSVLLGGRVADVFGRKRTLLAGLALFALGAACAGLAPGAGALVVSRALQGLGVAFAAPAAISTLTTTFPGRHERSLALGIWAAVGGLGTAVGLVTGGLVTETVGWEWIGAIDVTVVALAVALVLSLLPAGGRSRRSLDLAGAALVTTGLSAAVLAVSRIASDGLGAGSTLAAACLAAVLLGAFLLVEQRVDDPLLPLGLVRAPCVSAANIVAVLVAASVASMMLLLTLASQRVLRLHTRESRARAPGALGDVRGLGARRITARRAGRARERLSPPGSCSSPSRSRPSRGCRRTRRTRATYFPASSSPRWEWRSPSSASTPPRSRPSRRGTRGSAPGCSGPRSRSAAPSASPCCRRSSPPTGHPERRRGAGARRRPRRRRSGWMRRSRSSPSALRSSSSAAPTARPRLCR